MRFAILIFTALFLLILQLGTQSLNWFFSPPNLVLIYFCIVLVSQPFKDVMVLALGVGVIVDMLSGLPDGVMAITYPAAVMLAHYVGTVWFDRAHDYALLIKVVVASSTYLVVSILVMAIISLIFSSSLPDFTMILSLRNLYNIAFDVALIVIVYPIYILQNRVLKYFDPKYESI